MGVFSLSRWRPYQLLLGWVVYWIALLIFALGPAVPAVLSATRKDTHGEINASFSNTLLSFTVKELGRVTWSGSVRFLTAALWIGVPPLVLWLMWLRARSSATRGEARPVGSRV
jgi:hypothetical protein